MRGYVVYSILPFFIRIQVFWTKMEYIPSDDDLIVDENDITSKRLYLSKGDTRESLIKRSVGFLLWKTHRQAEHFSKVLPHHQSQRYGIKIFKQFCNAVNPIELSQRVHLMLDKPTC